MNEPLEAPGELAGDDDFGVLAEPAQVPAERERAAQPVGVRIDVRDMAERASAGDELLQS
jgi:hypothetical protein